MFFDHFMSNSGEIVEFGKTQPLSCTNSLLLVKYSTFSNCLVLNVYQEVSLPFNDLVQRLWLSHV